MRDWSFSSSTWMVPTPFLPTVMREQRLLLIWGVCVLLVFGNVMGLDSDADS